jgi:hypothetical protein
MFARLLQCTLDCFLLTFFQLIFPSGVKETPELLREYPTMDRFLSIRICCSHLAPLLTNLHLPTPPPGQQTMADCSLAHAP